MKINHQQQAGISLVELMVAMVAGLILVGGVITMFIEVRTNLSRTEKVSALTTEGQFAIATISHDLALGGFWGKVFYPENIVYDATVFNSTTPSATVGADCGPQVDITVGGILSKLAWAYNVIRPFEFYNDSDSGLHSKFSCVNSSIVKPDTDVIAIRRVASVAIDAPTVNPDTKHRQNRVYLRADSGDGGLYRHKDGTPPTHPGLPTPAAGVTVEDWAYTPTLYFIRRYSRQAGDGIPTLCHKVFFPGDPPYFSTECIAEGIEDLQFEFGIDSDLDGVSNYFDADPTDAELANVTAIRIYLLARSLSEQNKHDDQNSYVMGSKTFIPRDGYLRQLYTMTVPIRNSSRLKSMQ